MKRKYVPLVFLTALLCTNIQADESLLKEPDLIYTNDQMLNFDAGEYLGTHAPHLLPHAEAISHWAGVSSISPKILIALMEHETSIVSIENRQVLSRPFGDLSDKEGFNEQLIDICNQLSTLHYEPVNNSIRQFSVARFLASKYTTPKSISELTEDFSHTYFRIFTDDSESGVSAPMLEALPNSGALPPSSLLQLPYPVGSTWTFGGAHSYTGSGNVLSSIDFHDGGYWGSNLSNKWVVASGQGTVKVHSSCNMEIIHASGWSTQYYHLDNILYSNGQSVSRDTYIANYASNERQALCQGGASTGPHLHFSLKYNGSYVSLQDVRLSDFTVNVGTSNYDTNCNRFYLRSNNGTKNCAGRLYNPGVSTPTDPTPNPDDNILKNGVAKSNLSASVNSKLMFTLDVPANARNLQIKMTGGSGDADLYVRFGSQPALNSYDCRPYLNNSNETCQFNIPRNGRYYVMINAYTRISGISLIASYTVTTPSVTTPKPTPTPEQNSW